CAREGYGSSYDYFDYW
nr:immunoglobulin heavy chain junction region [Mus musculus]